jgi:hypothetical protein
LFTGRFVFWYTEDPVQPMLKTTFSRILRAVMPLLAALHSPLYAQADTSYSFLAAGHAYGAHDGGNTGLHPALLSSLDSGFDPLAAFIVFTGDIVNQSTPESWQQVEDELSGYGLAYYFAMGNHDNNDAGRQLFEDRFGGTYYAFHCQSDLFIILNSTEVDRSISPAQLAFLEEQIMQSGGSARHIFIFFHELLWNSLEKYTGVMSNSRSRYDQMVDHSNYWEEVHPLLTANPDKDFYLFAGDVGGNSDAVAAFYDRWDNVTLLASGMGEVPDENYLLVRVDGNGQVIFELVPLNPGLSLPGIGFYSVPPSPEAITGPDTVKRGSTGIEYAAEEVFNATSYVWELPAGLTGSSTSDRISVDVDSGFTGGIIAVRAERDGFGRGGAVSKTVTAGDPTVGMEEEGAGSRQVGFLQTVDGLVIRTEGLDGKVMTLRIFDGLGRQVRVERVPVRGDGDTWRINRSELPKGIIIISASVQSRQIHGKFMIK